MKKTFLLISLLVFSLSISAQDYCMTSPIGFGRNATGGAGGTVVTVNSVTALRTALQNTAPAIIIVTQDINFAGAMISVKVNNKTLLGLPGVKLIQLGNTGILGFSSGSSNFIIRNLIFEGPSAWDMDGQDLLQNTNCTNLWVDHCEFYDGMDGNFDNTNNADNISISWCKFGYKKPYRYIGMTGDGNGDHRLTNLVGGSGTNAPADGHFSITFQLCYWADGCLDRMPRARNAELHMLNCYYNVTTYDSCIVDAAGTVGTRGRSISTKAINLTGGNKGTTCYIEGVHFKKITTMAQAAAESGTTASMKLVDCIPVAGRSLPANAGTTTTQPTYPYTALPAANVEAAILNPCGAGATLIVDLQGNVSSACGTATPPETPQNVQASTAADSITVSWNAVADATGYVLKIGEIIPGQTGSGETTTKTWNFAAPWTITAADEDANLKIDGGNRFNYAPATSNQELKFANGTVIPDVAGLLFTAGATSKLRLGFATGMLYLNGGGIKIAIPCSIGDKISVTSVSGNSAETNRGFTVTGGTLDALATSANINNGILTVAGDTGVWVYNATSTSLELTTVQGGMNIFKITVTTNGGATTEPTVTYTEYPTENTSFTVKPILPETEYTYQVKAINNGLSSEYSAVQSIITSQFTDVKSPYNDKIKLIQTANELTVSGVGVKELTIYDISGQKLMQTNNSQKINISSLHKGSYILSIRCNTDERISKKIIKY